MYLFPLLQEHFSNRGTMCEKGEHYVPTELEFPKSTLKEVSRPSAYTTAQATPRVISGSGQ